MIITLTFTLRRGSYLKHDWQASVEIEQDYTLDDIHFVIQDLVGFDNDHLYDFFLATSQYNLRSQYSLDDELGYERTIGSMFPLPKHRKLFYLFDWGDMWVFQISKDRKRPKEAEKRKKYPRVVSKAGRRPQQYGSGEW